MTHTTLHEARNLSSLAPLLLDLSMDFIVRMRGFSDLFERTCSSGVPDLVVAMLMSPRLRTDVAPFERVNAFRRMSYGTLVLEGPPDFGKSTAAGFFASETGAFWLEAQLIESWQYATWEKERAALLAHRALVIDDLGGLSAKEPQTCKRVADLLVNRHHRMRRTLLTTNLSITDFSRAVDGGASGSDTRIGRVLRRGGAGEWVTLDGQPLCDGTDVDMSELVRAREVVCDAKRVRHLGDGDFVEESRPGERLLTAGECIDAFHRLRAATGISMVRLEQAREDEYARRNAFVEQCREAQRMLGNLNGAL